ERPIVELPLDLDAGVMQGRRREARRHLVEERLPLRDVDRAAVFLRGRRGPLEPPGSGFTRGPRLRLASLRKGQSQRANEDPEDTPPLPSRPVLARIIRASPE